MRTEPIKVKELIEILKAADPDTPVYFWDTSNECYKKLYYAGVEEIEVEDEDDSLSGFTIG